MRRFAGKIALVTGGARGIGRVISTRLAEEGARVVINCLHSYDDAKELRAELTARGLAADVIRASVARPAQLDRMFAEIESGFGGLDILVNNAADGAFASALETREEQLDRALDTNFKGALWCAQRAHPLLVRRGGGAVVNLSSIGAGTVVGNYLPVGTAKAALESLTRYLAAEWAPDGIRVNAASGGLIEGRVAGLFPDAEAVRELSVRNTPLGRLGKEEELADLVLFLLSDAARWVTGQTVVADGGLSLGGALLTVRKPEAALKPEAVREPEAAQEPEAAREPEAVQQPEAVRTASVVEPVAVPAPPSGDLPHAVAVVGTGLVVPGASNVEEFWQACLDGPELLDSIRSDRFHIENFYSPDRSAADKTYQTKSGYCDEYRPHPWLAEELGPDRRDVEYTTQWFRHALHDAIRNVRGLESARVHCAIGYTADGNQHLEEAIVVEGLLEELDVAAGRAGWSPARRAALRDQAGALLRERYPLSRVPYRELLPHQVGENAVRGLLPPGTPLTMVDTACSSSLYALDMGVKAIMEGACDVAVCGGSFAVGPRNAVLFAKLHGLSTTGHVRPLDSACDGVIFSDGAAAITLKRADLALRDGDEILGYIGPIGTSSDGKGKAIYAPNVVGQRMAVERALARPGGGRPDWIIAHATGTPAGDLCEVTSLRETLAGEESGDLRLTSNKSLVGHTGWAAGAVSIIQALEGLRHDRISPQHRFDQAPEEYGLAGAGIEIPTGIRPWPRREDGPRTASVSGFGFGGTNAHVMVADRPMPQPAPGDDEIVIVSWSAHVPGLESAGDVQRWLTGSGEEPAASFGPTYDASKLKLRMPPKTVRTLDRCQLMMLRCAEDVRTELGEVWNAHRRTIGTFIGHMGPTRHAVEYGKRCHVDNALEALATLGLDEELIREFRQAVGSNVPASNEDSFPGIMPNVISARVSNHYDLNGPNMVLDLGHGSVLSAFDVAARYLRAGDVDLALVGGVNGNTTTAMAKVVRDLAGEAGRTDPAEGAVLFAVARRSTAELHGLPVLASVGPVTYRAAAAASAAEPARPGRDRVTCGPHGDDDAGRYLGAEAGFAVLRALCRGTRDVEIAAADTHEGPIVSLGLRTHGTPAPSSDLLLDRYVARWQPAVNDGVRPAAATTPADAVIVTATPESLGDLGTRPDDPLVLSVVPTGGVRRRWLADLSPHAVRAALGDAAVSQVRVFTDLGALAPAHGALDGDPDVVFRLQDAVFLVLQTCESAIRERQGTVLGLFTGAEDSGVLHPYSGLFTGLLKSVALELRPWLVAGVFTDTRDFATGLEELRQESRATQFLPVARYRDGVRHVLMAEVEPVVPGTDDGLGADSVLVAVGGARGITPELLKELARRHRPTVYAIGSQPLEDLRRELEASGGPEALRDKAAFIRAVMSTRDGKSAKDAIAAHERLSRAAESLANLAEIERWCGQGRVHYRRADVTDLGALRAVMDEIHAAHGRIDLLLHAAGVNRAGALGTKPIEHFRQVRDIKVGGYFNLRSALRGRLPRRWCSFSSLIGLTGQLGETDYAAANDFLASAATYTSVTGEVDELSIGWTLWKETGMASSPVHHSFFAGAQADTLTQMPTAEGVHHFMAELEAAGSGGATFHMGAIERAAVERMMPGYWQPRTPPRRGRFYVDQASPGAAGELTVERLFTEQRDGYLSHHLVAGAPTLPGCFVTELIAEAALLHTPGWRVIGFRDIVFHHFLKLGGSTARSPKRTRARLVRRDSRSALVEVEVVGDVMSPAGTVLVKDKLHFRGKALLAPGYPPSPRIEAWPAGREEAIVDPYHAKHAPVALSGPFVTTTATRLHEFGKRALYTAPVGPGSVFEDFLVPVLLLDGLARLAVLEVVDDHYVPLAAPTAIRRIDIYHPDNDVDLNVRGVPIELSVTPRGLLYTSEGEGSRFTATLPDGRVLLQMKDVAGVMQGYVDVRTGEAVRRTDFDKVAAHG